MRKLIWAILGLGACAGFYLEWRALQRKIERQAVMIAALEVDLANVRHGQLQQRDVVAAPRLDLPERQSDGALHSADSQHLGLFGLQSPLRLVRVNRYLVRHPELSIPEFRLLDDDAWNRVLAEKPLKTEADLRAALATARSFAEQQSGRMMVKAVERYMAANEGKSPPQASALAPYLPDPSYVEFFSSFTLYDGASKNPAPGGDTWVLQARSIDPAFDIPLHIGASDSFGVGASPPAEIVARAVEKFRNATGSNPSDASQLSPYLTAALPPGIITEVINAGRSDAP